MSQGFKCLPRPGCSNVAVVIPSQDVAEFVCTRVIGPHDCKRFLFCGLLLAERAFDLVIKEFGVGLWFRLFFLRTTVDFLDLLYKDFVVHLSSCLALLTQPYTTLHNLTQPCGIAPLAIRALRTCRQGRGEDDTDGCPMDPDIPWFGTTRCTRGKSRANRNVPDFADCLHRRTASCPRSLQRFA